jgi:AhpC/TSA family
MNGDLVHGKQLIDVELPDHNGHARRLSDLAAGDPLVVNFYRGWWCPRSSEAMRGASRGAAGLGEHLRPGRHHAGRRRSRFPGRRPDSLRDDPFARLYPSRTLRAGVRHVRLASGASWARHPALRRQTVPGAQLRRLTDGVDMHTLIPRPAIQSAPIATQAPAWARPKPAGRWSARFSPSLRCRCCCRSVWRFRRTGCCLRCSSRCWPASLQSSRGG